MACKRVLKVGERVVKDLSAGTLAVYLIAS
jgi:hypothetical protein